MSDGGELRAWISDQPLDPAEVEKAVLGPEHGAVVVFTGMVRNHDGGQAVSTLEYSAHPEAEKFLRRVCAEVAESSGLPVAAVHRIGPLAIGDLAIAVAVAAPIAPKPSPPARLSSIASNTRSPSGSASSSPTASPNGSTPAASPIERAPTVAVVVSPP